jgi:acyl-CoA oxidase
LEKLHKNL